MSDTSARTDKGKPPPKWILKAVTRVHTFLYNISGHRWLNTLGGDEVCFVDMTGAKSGKKLTIPLMYVPHGQEVLLVASMGGAPKNPVWHNNLVKNPDVEVSYRGDRKKFRARLATADEKPTLWPVCYKAYAPFEAYRKRTTRDIPIFVCEPAA